MYNNELPVKRNRTQLATNLEKINNWVEYVETHVINRSLDDTLTFPVVHASSFSQFVGAKLCEFAPLCCQYRPNMLPNCEGNVKPRGNDAQHFYTLSGASQNTTEAKPIIQHNASEIIRLLRVYKFVPLPCVRRKTVLRFSDAVVHYTP
ncbi:11060_t:CDS:2 [Paraglomus brasilianum]|uniref:11060_t:CDS:1 n=1 Tax=Paraglomus brasilianum TaxID=144538 RepID=A0A9N9CUI8_9GLOM|nr:11060_t:CDS:2 [Paraglomus brasilianum]